MVSAKISASEYVYNQLKEEIMFLELLPGQSIIEVDTSKRFNVSRTPVRAAFNRLESEGLVLIKPKYGSFVTLIDIDEISDLMYMREKLELAVLMDVEHITKSQEVKLNVLLLQQLQILNSDIDKNDKAKKFLEADNEFHSMLFSLTNKENIWRKLSEGNPHYNRLRLLSNIESREGLFKIQEEHVKIKDALLNKDFDLLKEYYNVHIYEGMDNLANIVNNYSKFFK